MNKKNDRKKMVTLSLLPVFGSLLTDMYIVYLRGDPSFSFTFYILAIFTVSSITLLFNISARSVDDVKLLLLFSLFASYCLMKMIIPIGLPHNVLSNYPDAYFEYQVANAISSYGRLIFNPDSFTNQAKDYSLLPGLGLIAVTVSSVTGAPLYLFYKYVGIFTSGIVTPLFSIVLFTNMVKFVGWTKRVGYLSTLMFLFSPWVLGFLIHANHSTISVPLFILLMLVFVLMLRDSQSAWPIVFIVISLALVLSHHYMGFSFIVLLFFFIILLFIFNSIHKSATGLGTHIKRTVTSLIIIVLLFIMYITYIAVKLGGGLLFMAEYLLSALFEGSITAGFEYYGTPQVSSVGIIVIKYLGFILFNVIGIINIMRYIIQIFAGRIDSRYGMFASISLSTILTGIVLVLPYIFYPKYGTDLFNRIFFFIYMGLSPFTVLSFEHSWKHGKSETKFHIPAIAFMILILLAGYFHAFNPYYVDWSTPIVSRDDIRFKPHQWVYLANYIREIGLDDTIIIGVRIGVGPIGGIAIKEYWDICQVFSINSSDISSLERFAGRYIAMRGSASLYNECSQSKLPEIEILLKQSILLYSSGEAMLLKIT